CRFEHLAGDLGLGANTEKIYAFEGVDEFGFVEGTLAGFNLDPFAFKQANGFGVDVFEEQRFHPAYPTTHKDFAIPHVGAHRSPTRRLSEVDETLYVSIASLQASYGRKTVDAPVANRSCGGSCQRQLGLQARDRRAETEAHVFAATGAAHVVPG